jgi:ribonuclease R
MEADPAQPDPGLLCPQNAGHFGLALGSYAHFTSPIRRYADLLVHRSLVGAFDLEQPAPPARLGLPAHPACPGGLTPISAGSATLISQYERRAMEAERETVDRYVAAYLAEHVGEVMTTRITGVQSFGFFATVDRLGGDGLVPVSTLGAERFHYFDETQHMLEGEQQRRPLCAGAGDRIAAGRGGPGGGYAAVRIARCAGV